MKHSFSLIALDLRRQPEGHILKTLKRQVYFLDRRYTEVDGRILYRSEDVIDKVVNDLYGENIRIQAIVGKNGSGKSSLLEIIYRIINNFTCSVLNKAGEPYRLLYVDGLDADMYFQKEGAIYKVSCMLDQVSLATYTSNHNIDYLYSSSDDTISASVLDISKHLFYTIVTNYAPQSMISNDYLCEYNYLTDNSGNSKDRSSWMKYIFHKNDGYLTPICLAPFRDVNGAINISLENKLTLYRLSTIFLYYQHRNHKEVGEKYNLIDGYDLHEIRYTFNSTDVLSKFSDWTETNILGNPIRKYRSSVFAYILNYYKLWDLNLLKTNNLYLLGCMYFVVKILNIIETYPIYAEFLPLIYKKKSYYTESRQHRDVMASVPSEKQKESWKLVLHAIDIDRTHVTNKFRQARALLLHVLVNYEKEDVEWLSSSDGFTFDQYINRVRPEGGLGVNFERLSAYLPPSFFDIDIKLQLKNDNKERPIRFSELSSGERQYLCVLSTYVYHILNIESIAVQGDRVCYNDMVLIMDEVEICFHPDYQRQFISRLLRLLIDFKFNKGSAFYILISTHSPFILSDIPQSNILYIEDGEVKNDQITVNPFCANVNDILYQSFFMKEGFSGTFATSKVRELMSFLKSNSKRNKKGWNIERAEYFIENMVGDPLLQAALQVMLKDKPKK